MAKHEGVYNIKSGEFIKREPVDCRELVATGEYSYDAPAAKVAALEIGAPEVIATEIEKAAPKGSKK